MKENGDGVVGGGGSLNHRVRISDSIRMTTSKID